jgi:phage terminase small subunit
MESGRMGRGPGGGRRPLPTAVKRLRGNPGRRKPNPAEPDFPSGEPDMPSMLSPTAQVEWKSLIPQLAVVGLRRIDGKALAGYCVCYSR